MRILLFLSVAWVAAVATGDTRRSSKLSLVRTVQRRAGWRDELRLHYVPTMPRLCERDRRVL